MSIFRFHVRDRKLSKILSPLIRVLKKGEFRKTKNKSYDDEEDDLFEIVDYRIALKQEIEDEDEEENDQLFENTIKTLQSIDKENNTDLTWTYLVNSVFH